MTQAQRILQTLSDNDGKHLSFGEIYEHLHDMPKGTLSAILANLAKEGSVHRQERDVDDGRNLQEYMITDDGKNVLAEYQEKGTKTRKRRQVKKAAPSQKVEKPSPASFEELQKFSEHQTEYQNLRDFVQFLSKNDALKKNHDVDAEILQYIGIDPSALSSERQRFESLLSSVSDR